MTKQHIEPGQRIWVQPAFTQVKAPPHAGTYIRTLKSGLLLYYSDWWKSECSTAWHCITHLIDDA